MRVIAGRAKRISLVTPEGSTTRPTTDRIKETLFNMLQMELYDIVFLDLFSGSGAIGIEALSRRAKRVVFVENNLSAQKAIKTNLAKTRLEEQAQILTADYKDALVTLSKKKEAFDIIFMDPPYNQGIEEQVLLYLIDSTLLHEKTKIIVEASLETEFLFADAMGYEIIRHKEYKTNQHVFLQKKGTL